ncbi:M12 family metallopeptidase [Fluviispira sanaruensis]|uniref:Peptidase M12A domain-containing protein n=1 Tax=Fluviispira sanaruensis TaxID=2493639 RepID=A0A4P2VI68_FLUSA|nr:M12 family metallopeptidase [Fluviispira sanaruensis]BBH52706.1 hypothetical protein JCM31447_11480 [Fluviispira sanaruensis]
MFYKFIKQAFFLTLFFVYNSFLYATYSNESLNLDFTDSLSISESQRVNRSAPTYENFFWKNGKVHYKFENNKFSDEEITSVRSAMQTLESYANVSFLEITNTAYFNNLVTIRKGDICSSTIGRNPFLARGVKRSVTLSNDGSCFHNKILLHELMHTLGFHHEHSRFDRDNYIEIIEKNIKLNVLHNFKKVGDMTVRFGDYDYDSIMHYSQNANSKDEYTARFDQTIKPLKNGVKIGKNNHLSAGDIDGLIKAYGPPLNKNPKYIEFKNSAVFSAQINLKYYYNQSNSNQWSQYSWWGMRGDKKTYTLPSNVDFVEVTVSFRSIFDWYDLEYITYLKDDLPICLETWGTLFSPQLSRC